VALAAASVAAPVSGLATSVASEKATSDNIEPAPSHTHIIEKIVERIVERPLRRRLPDTRHAKTHKFDVAGHEGYITAGLYEDGSPGEVFITMAKEGSTIGGLMDAIATLVSVSLQYGVPVESLVRKFEHVRFEPSGMTRNPEIPIAKSLIDYIFRWLAMEFVPGYRDANAPKRPAKKIEANVQPSTPSPSQGEGRGEGSASTVENASTSQPARKKEGNGHGRHLEQDSKPFDYTGEESPKSAPSSSQDPGPQLIASLRLTMAVDPLSQQGSELQSDAPACDVCGSITVRSGTCYKCLNCGNSMGCS
jgi:ribonucleoside-diphosphate reductase alpha chain